MTNWLARHGDIPVFSVGSIPKDAEGIKFDGSFPVAFGEVTFHHHSLFPTRDTDMKVYKKDNVYFVHCLVDVPLRHQEHKEIVIPKGFWGFGREVQRDPFLDSISKVKD